MTAPGFGLEIGPLGLMRNEFDDFTIVTKAVSATFGDVQPIAKVIGSLMRDGNLTLTNSFGNRTAAFDVTIEATSHLGLVAGSEILELQLDKPNLLTYRVPYGPPTIFQVMRSWSDFMYEDVTETPAGDMLIKRRFRVFFECLPFGRSKDRLQIVWNGPGIELDPLSSLAGWTIVDGSPTAGGIFFPGFTGAGTASFTVSRALPITEEFLWIKTQSSASATMGSLSVGGVSIPSTKWFATVNGNIYIVDVSAWVGQSPVIEIQALSPGGGDPANLSQLWTCRYPNKPNAGDTRPKGIDVLRVPGSARAGFVASWISPAGGSFVYTGPDPTADIRERGTPEITFQYAVTVDPPDNYLISSTTTSPQPVQLHPNGVWPQGGTGGSAGVSSHYSYPANTQAAVTFFKTTGNRQIVSADNFLPQGYNGGAIAHENHVLHARDCGFMVCDAAGNPISTLIEFYPHHKHMASL